MPEFEI